MEASRRTVLTSTLAGSTLVVLRAVGLGRAEAATSPAGSPTVDVLRKITVGYQGWFSCDGDGAPIGGWWHWAPDRPQPPSPRNNGINAWHDLQEYTEGYSTAFANLGNGQPATLLFSCDQQTVDTHFRWMRQYGRDTATMQRFNPTADEGPTRDAMAAKVRSAAETYNMYVSAGRARAQPLIAPPHDEPELAPVRVDRHGSRKRRAAVARQRHVRLCRAGRRPALITNRSEARSCETSSSSTTPTAVSASRRWRTAGTSAPRAPVPNR